MDSFIKLSNFGKLPICTAVSTGSSRNCIVVTVYSSDWFCSCSDPRTDAYVKHPSVPCSGSRP